MLSSMSFESEFSEVLMGLAREATQLNDAGAQKEGAPSPVSIRATFGRDSIFFQLFSAFQGFQTVDMGESHASSDSLAPHSPMNRALSSDANLAALGNCSFLLLGMDVPELFMGPPRAL